MFLFFVSIKEAFDTMNRHRPKKPVFLIGTFLVYIDTKLCVLTENLILRRIAEIVFLHKNSIELNF